MTAKALRRVEQLARIVTTYEDDLIALSKATRPGTDVAPLLALRLVEVVSELRIALVDLDLARHADGLVLC